MDAKTDSNDSDSDDIVQLAAAQLTNTQDPKASPTSGTGTTAPTSEEDNMDYDSDDDDDSKSNHSNSNHGSNRRMKQKGDMKRSHHNVLERKRRDLIKDSFAKLRDAVPTLSGERASRAQILKRAADFIQHTHQRNESFKGDIKELVKKNQELESKLCITKLSGDDGVVVVKTEALENAATAASPVDQMMGPTDKEKS